MGKSNNKSYLVDYGIILSIVIVAARIRQYAGFAYGSNLEIAISIAGTVIFCLLSIFGLALILKLILNRNGIKPDYIKLSSKVAISLIPLLVVKPLINYFTTLGWHQSLYFVAGVILLLPMIAIRFKLPIRAAFFITSFSFFTYFVLITIFYAIRI